MLSAEPLIKHQRVDRPGPANWKSAAGSRENEQTSTLSSGYPCSSAVQPTALSKIDTAISRASKALDAEQNGKIEDAFYWWDMVFGGMFPSYH